ncbi:MAG: glycosyltransferase family 4 protein, partial [Gemmataceae bacterium]
PVLKNKYYFALRNARATGDLMEVVNDCERFSQNMINDARWHYEGGRLSQAEFDAFQTDVARAVRDGLERGMTCRRKSGKIPAANPSAFKPFPILKPSSPRMTVVFISQEFPPENIGGVGRFTHELAEGMAAAGHEIHVVTKTSLHPRVDLEQGVWVHRIPPQTEGAWAPEGIRPGMRRVLGWAAAAHTEVKRIAADRTVDLVSAPIWDCEGLFCHLDDDLKTVLTLVTTVKTAVDMNPGWLNDPAVRELLAMEEFLVRRTQNILAPSADILRKVKKDTGAKAPGVVVPLGLSDRSIGVTGRKPDGKVRILTVGRVEKRKGTDLFLAAAGILAPEFPQAEFVIVGDDRIPIDGLGCSYREDFERTHGHEAWAKQVFFQGKVTEAELSQAYADCDIFCLPARYESFGLVLVEAMAFSKPVIGAAPGGMGEIVTDGEVGFLMYPESVGSLVAQLRPLIEDAELRERFGMAARERYEAEYHQDVMVRNTLAAYRTIAQTVAV